MKTMLNELYTYVNLSLYVFYGFATRHFYVNFIQNLTWVWLKLHYDQGSQSAKWFSYIRTLALFLQLH